MNKESIEITGYEGEGYLPLIDFEGWRIAYLRYCEELEPQNLNTMQKHNETDEVFVLLSGKCTLFIGEKGEHIGEITTLPMQPLKLYNIKRGVWHTHTLDHEATVLIVENQNTSNENSPTLGLSDIQKQSILQGFHHAW